MLRSNAGRLVLEPAGEIAQQPLGFVSVVELPGLSQRLAHRGMQRLGQALDHVAGLVNLAALDRRVPAEGRADHLGQRLRAIDDEQPADLGIEPAFDQVVDERLHDGGVLGGAFDKAKRMLVALSIDPERGHQDQVVADVQAVDLDDQKIQLGQVRGHPLGHALGRERHEPARRRRFRRAVTHDRRQIALGQPHRALKLARRYVDQHQVHRPAAKPILGLGRPPGRQRNLVAVAAHARPTHINLAAVEADLSLRRAPALANALPRLWRATSQPLRVLAQHLLHRFDAGRQTEALE